MNLKEKLTEVADLLFPGDIKQQENFEKQVYKDQIIIRFHGETTVDLLFKDEDYYFKVASSRGWKAGSYNGIRGGWLVSIDL